jgi:tripartite-type tricarboxylate transporter receptor subunit TctC
MPAAAAATLAGAISKALATPQFRDKLAGLGATPVGGSPEAFGELLRRENAKWARAIKDAGIKIE